MAESLQAIHYDREIPDVSKQFEIICPPDTDVWEKPPSTHSFNAPIIYKTTSKAAFTSARVTVSGEWRHKYDQGGLCLIFNCKDKRRWVKTGIEFYQDKPYVSSVGTDQWSDWALTPTLEGSDKATLEIRPFDGALWIFLVGADSGKVPVREIAWWEALADDTEVWVGVYAAKPAKEKDNLTVRFEGLQL